MILLNSLKMGVCHINKSQASNIHLNLTTIKPACRVQSGFTLEAHSCTALTAIGQVCHLCLVRPNVAVPCCAVPCCAVTGHAVLCRAVPCLAVLWYAMQLSHLLLNTSAMHFDMHFVHAGPRAKDG